VAQDYAFTQTALSVKDGLSSSNTMSFFMDSQGIMWMTGGLGLDRYDGYRFEHYTVNGGQLLTDDFTIISEGPGGNIWLSKQGENYGIQLFDPVRRESKWWWQEIDTTALKGGFVQSVLQDQTQPAIWLVTEHNVLRYSDSRSLEETFHSHSPILEAMASKEGLWLYSKGSLRLISPQGSVTREFELPSDATFALEAVDGESNIYYRKQVNSEDLDRSKKYRNESLFGSDEKKTWDRYLFLSLNPIEDQILTSDVLTNDMVVFSTSLKEIARFKPNPHFYKFPPRFYWDHLGNGWTHFNEEVHVFNLSKNQFKNHLTNIITYGELGIGSRGIHFDNDTSLFVSSLGGTFILNPETGKHRRFWSKGERNDAADLLGLRQLAILKTSDERIYFSNEGGRINYYEPKNDKYGTLYPENDAPEKGLQYMNWAIHEDVFGGLWIAQDNGLSRVKKSTNSYAPFKAYNGFEQLKNSSVYDFYNSTDSTIWIGSENGLYRLHPEKGIIEKAKIPLTTSQELSVMHINSFSNKGLYLATRHGVIHYDPLEEEVIQRWTTNEGLSDNVCYAVYQDAYSRLWVPSNKGINLINPDGTIQVFQTGDGLIHNEFNRISHAQAPDGRLFFGSLNGVTEFDPSDFPTKETSDSKVLLTSLRIQRASDGSYENYEQVLSSISKIELRPSDLGLELQFSLLDYLGNDFRSFSYKIEGLDNDWTYVNKPEIRINRLPYGEYRLILRGQAPNGALTSEKEISLDILRPFYLRWWFFLIMSFLITLSILFIQRNREKKFKQRQKELEVKINDATEEIRQQAEELKSLDRLKSNFFANISHELKTPLSLVLAPLEKTLKKSPLDNDTREDLALAQRNALSVGNLVNEILDLTRLENGVAQPRYSKVHINSFLELLTENFRPKAQSENITLRFNSQIQEDDLWILDRNMTEKIINNLLSNALRHTPSLGKVTVTAVIKSELIIQVIDTGSGISEEDLPHVFDRFFQTKDPNKKAEGGTGIGLALSNELAQVMDGDLEVHSVLGKGSTFTLALPKADTYQFSEAFEELSLSENGEFPALIDMQFNLLLVDDNEDIRSFIKNNLKDQFDIITASNGSEALSYLEKKSQDIHLIISDMMMPNMDGLELLEKLKAEPATQNIPVIFLTARTAERDKMEAFRIGVDDYLTKPFSLDELNARIRNLLKAAMQRRIASEIESVDLDLDMSLTDNEKWLKEFRKLTEEQLTAVDFSIGSLASKMGMSESTLFRKIKKLTGYSPNIYLKEIRLQMAKKILEKSGDKSIKEISFQVGINSTKYFSRLFKERFGKLPSDYQRLPEL
jgi:signal transduction histidine kinase/DNA-binding response OmpR family regulator/ligand-binding sensor domain-containing protein